MKGIKFQIMIIVLAIVAIILILLMATPCPDKRISEVNDCNVSEKQNSDPILLPSYSDAHYANVRPTVFFEQTIPVLMTSTLDPQDPKVSCIYPVEVNSSKVSSSPLCIHSETGLVEWSPNVGDAGLYRVAFRATDPNDDYDEEIVEITVTKTNQPPYLFVKATKLWH